eukprot:3186038-Rhodomonas_salina.1
MLRRYPPPDAQYCASVCSYAVCGTALRYAPTQCAVREEAEARALEAQTSAGQPPYTLHPTP